MDNIFYFILFVSILSLIGKYIMELKSDKTLVVVLALLGFTCLGYVLKYIFHAPFFISIGLISGMIISPIVLSAYLIKQKGNGKDGLTRKLMLFPTLTLFFTYLSKGLHLPNYGLTILLMVISLIIGGYIMFSRYHLKEVKPIQVILIFIVIDLLTFLTK